MDTRERVMALEGNLLVTAGAGAGKTSCLVEAYLRLLTGNSGRPPMAPSEILAITFTDKAAAEMRSRIVGQVQERISRAQGVGNMAGMLPQLEWAPISTIHAFCAEMLREFGGGLGLDPDFGVLDAEQFNVLRQETCLQVMTQRLEASDQALLRALAQYRWQGRAGLVEVLLSLVQRLATLGFEASAARHNTAEAFDKERTGQVDILADMDAAVGELAEGISHKKYNNNAKYYGKVNKLLEYWPDLKKGLAHYPPQPAILARLKELVAGGWGKANDQRQALAEALKQLAGLANLEQAAGLSDDLLYLAGLVAGAIDQELMRRAVLSFDHLLLLTLRLVQEPGPVLDTLRQRFKAIMVDEFQDVNPVQGRIIRLLAGLDLPSGQPGKERPLLLLVGDRKQSIYGFRGADVSLYANTMEAFDRRRNLAALAENFRSSHALVKFFNRLFAKVFVAPHASQDVEGFQVSFRLDDQQTPAANSDDREPRPVRVLDCRGLAQDKLPAAAWRVLEARALASYLGQLLDQGVQPGSIVLLFRRLTQVAVYEEALRRLGLDFYTVRGSGFYQCQEVADMALALRAILDPGDSLALAGFLRSPLVGLSDEALWALCHPDDQRFVSLPEALASRTGLPDWLGQDQAKRWQAAMDLVEDLTPMARRLEPAEVLGRLMRACDLPAVWAADTQGGQRTANLRKLMETARDAALGPFGSTQGFARELMEMINNPPDMAQASLAGQDADTLRIMSVHQAKGLEFDTVILPDLAWRPRTANDPVLLDEYGVAAASPYDPLTGERAHSALYRRLAQQEKLLDEAESARLFYVACTRARRRLVFCQTGQKGAWSGWVQEHVLQDPAVEVIEADQAREAALVRQGPAMAWPGWLPEQAGPQAPEGALCLKGAFQATPRQPERFSESVTGLGNWLECPRRYLWVRRLGLDTANIMNLRTNNIITSTGQVQLGTLVHRVLEITELEAGQDAALATLQSLAKGGEDLPQELLERAGARLTSWWDSKLAELISKKPKPRIMRESGFRVHLPGNGRGPDIQLIGNIDLLLRWDDGRQLIIDYKVTDKEDMGPYVYQLALYAMALRKNQTEVQEVPETGILFLGRAGASLQYRSFGENELGRWEGKVRQAALAINRLDPDITPSMVPVGQNCQPGECPLASICQPEATAP